MIWDFIRDFIVQHITGGYDSNGIEFPIALGINPNTGDEVNNFGVCFPVGVNGDDLSTSQYLGLGDWLATTITAVIMVLIVVALVLLVRWVFKAVVNAFTLR